MIVHEGRVLGTFTCGHCTRTFQDFAELDIHVLEHDISRQWTRLTVNTAVIEESLSAPPYTCRFCDFDLSAPVSLLWHLRDKHGLSFRLSVTEVEKTEDNRNRVTLTSAENYYRKQMMSVMLDCLRNSGSGVRANGH